MSNYLYDDFPSRLSAILREHAVPIFADIFSPNYVSTVLGTCITNGISRSNFRITSNPSLLDQAISITMTDDSIYFLVQTEVGRRLPN